jgi:hypothetical protein
MLTSRGEALRRLGGPVCPVCDTVGAEGVEVRFLSGNGSQWLKARGKGNVEREYLAPMCSGCFRKMTDDLVEEQAAEAARRAREDTKAAADDAYLGSLGGGMAYREACAEHGDDLEAAEQMAADWMGNGLFGSRGE